MADSEYYFVPENVTSESLGVIELEVVLLYCVLWGFFVCFLTFLERTGLTYMLKYLNLRLKHDYLAFHMCRSTAKGNVLLLKLRQLAEWFLHMV